MCDYIPNNKQSFQDSKYRGRYGIFVPTATQTEPASLAHRHPVAPNSIIPNSQSALIKNYAINFILFSVFVKCVFRNGLLLQ